MVVKVSRMPMADDEGHIIANWPTTQVSPAANVEDPHLRPLGIQIIGLSPRAMRARVINQVVPHESGSPHIASRANHKPILSDPTEVIYAVQQPDGEKLAIARICKDVTLETVPIGTSSSASTKQGHSLASHLTCAMSPNLDTTINVPQLHSVLREGTGLVTMVTPVEGMELPACSDHIEELEEIEIHEQPQQSPP